MLNILPGIKEIFNKCWLNAELNAKGENSGFFFLVLHSSTRRICARIISWTMGSYNICSTMAVEPYLQIFYSNIPILIHSSLIRAYFSEIQTIRNISLMTPDCLELEFTSQLCNLEPSPFKEHSLHSPIFTSHSAFACVCAHYLQILLSNLTCINSIYLPRPSLVTQLLGELK